MQWSEIKSLIGKGLNDSSFTQHGEKLKSAFSSAYREFVLQALPEELQITRSDQTLTPNNGVAEFTLPVNVIFKGLTEKDEKRLLEVDYQTFQRARNNTYLVPSSDEIMFYKDNNVIRFLTSETKSNFDIYIQYVPDFSFTAGTSMSDSAIYTIIEMTIDKIAGRYGRSKTD